MTIIRTIFIAGLAGVVPFYIATANYLSASAKFNTAQQW